MPASLAASTTAFYVESTSDQDGKYNDVVKDMIPSETAILASTAMAGAMLYGGIAVTEQNQIIVHAARRVARPRQSTLENASRLALCSGPGR